MSVPFVIYILIFKYGPLGGWIMAFQDYRPALPMFRQPLVGFKHFIWLFTNDQFYIVLRNTIVMAVLNIGFGTIASITLALLLNEIKVKAFKRTVQTISYLPHFLSWVIVVSLLNNILHVEGVLNNVTMSLGLREEPRLFLQEPRLAWPIVTLTTIWKNVGWGSIIYLAAIAGIDPQLYEAATMDGCRRMQKMRYVTLPGMKPTIVILLIMNIGRTLTAAGFELQLLIENGIIRRYTETLEIFALHYGLHIRQYSLGAASGIFTTFVSIALLLGANKIADVLGEESLM